MLSALDRKFLPNGKGVPATEYNLSYYHPNICDMNMIKNAMEPYKGKSGHFLLRNSFSKSGSFTLSVMHSTGLKHVKIESDSHHFYLKDIRFSTIDDLVTYYKVHEVPNTEKIHDVCLKYPIRFQENQNNDDDMGIYIEPLPKSSGVKAPEPPPRPVSGTAAGSGPQKLVPVSSSQYIHTSITTRPQPPIPDESEKYVYDKVENTPKIDLFKHKLNELEGEGNEVCDCGLRLEEAELPRGWSLHINREKQFDGELFFMSPDGTSCWSLPMNILLELTAEQQDRIKNFIFDFESKTGRTAMANRDPSGRDSVNGILSLFSQTCSLNSPSSNGDYQAPMRANSRTGENGSPGADGADVAGTNSNIARKDSTKSVYATMDKTTILISQTASAVTPKEYML